MANWCTTYYAILTKKNYEGLARIWEQLKLGRAVIQGVSRVLCKSIQ